MTRKIGIYGGSFDPVHIGHINLAIEIAEAHNLDEVWFCPAAINPLKQQRTAAGPAARLEMLHLATADIPNFKVIDIELQRPPPSYTIDTLRHLLAQPPTALPAFQLYLIFGADAIPHFHQWHQAEEIVKLVPLLIGQRSHDSIDKAVKGSPEILQAMQKGLTPTRILDVSSTEIRKRLPKHLYCGHLLHAKVLDYISANHLYSDVHY